MKQIEPLLNKYLDGRTSNEEEQRLKDFFAHCGNDIPEEWEAYRALFAFESMESGKRNGEDTRKVSEKQPANDTKTVSIRRRNRRLGWIITAAACISLILVITLGHGNRPKNYAVIDGKKYTDPEMVKQQAFEALNNVSTDDEETFGALSE